MYFKDLELAEPLLRALAEQHYQQPTPIQEQAIPHVLQRRDVLGCAQTGTGKTAAFAIPLLQLLHNRKSSVKTPIAPHARISTLILAPTRELAIQIDESFKAYSKYLSIRSTVIFGGVSQHGQVAAIRKGVDVLIATPGRLLDLLQQRLISLQHISFFVLDEADRMLDMGFIHDVKRILVQLPVNRQTVFFSATISPEIQSLANTILKQPVVVKVAPPATTAERIDQSVYFVSKPDKKRLLAKLLQDQSIRTALVFSRTKHGADKITRDLQKAGIAAVAIHGNKSQNARQSALRSFSNGDIRVLVATDIAARGIDIESMSHVFNYDLPEVPETYVHRIGRTGRAGKSGTAITFCDAEEKVLLRAIEQLIRKQIDRVALPAEFAVPTLMVPAPKQMMQRRHTGNRFHKRANNTARASRY